MNALPHVQTARERFRSAHNSIHKGGLRDRVEMNCLSTLSVLILLRLAVVSVSATLNANYRADPSRCPITGPSALAGAGKTLPLQPDLPRADFIRDPRRVPP